MSSHPSFKYLLGLGLLLATRGFCEAPLPLQVQGSDAGFLKIYEGDNGRAVMGDDARGALKSLLSDEAYVGVNKALTGDWVLGKTYAGVTLRFDAEKVVIVADIPPESRRAERIDLNEEEDSPRGRVVKPDTLSAYMNMYAADSYLDGYGAEWQGRQPLHVDFDGAVNLGGWVLEGQPGYVEGDARPWMVQNVRVVKDDTERMLRYQVGELSYPTATFQSYRQLVGFGVARNFSLQPYLVTQPAGRSSFVLGSASTVDIYVNGVRQKSLQLQAGVYEMSDFPVVNGANDVKLVITDSSGRVEEKTFPVVSDGNLLGQGLAEFSFNGGIPVETVNRVRAFDDAHPLLSGLMRYGMTERWTTGVNLQGGATRQMAGLEQSVGTKLGMFRLENAASYTGEDGKQDGWGTAARLAYWNISANVDKATNRDTWQMAVQHRTANFNTVSSSSPGNPYSWEVQGSYGHSFTPDLSMSLGSDYRFGRLGQKDDHRTSANLYYRLMPQWTLNLNTSYSQQEQYGLFANLSWIAKDGRQSVDTSYDSSGPTYRSDWDYRPATATNKWNTRVQAEKSPDATALGGMVSYAGDRGTMRVEHERRMALGTHEMYGGLGTSTQMSAAGALVYSGGSFALSSPVVGSFAVVTPASKASGTTVALNPVDNDEGTVSEAESGWFGPAVLNDLTPYVGRTVNADVIHGDDLVRDSFVLKPTYKSGAHVLAGKKSRVVVTGYLKDADEKPLGLVGGQVSSNNTSQDPNDIEPAAGPDGEPRKPVWVFTNKDGRFQLNDLLPGRYSIIINGNKQAALDFDVPENVDTVNLGEQQILMRPGRAMATQAVQTGVSSTEPMDVVDDDAIEPAEGPNAGPAGEH